MKIENHHLGKSVAQIRKSRNMKQSDLAEATGYNQSTISLFERGERALSPEVLENLSAALECNVDDITSRALTIYEREQSTNMKGSGNFYSNEKFVTYNNDRRNDIDYKKRRLHSRFGTVIPIVEDYFLTLDFRVADLSEDTKMPRAHRLRNGSDSVISFIMENIFSELIQDNLEYIEGRLKDEIYYNESKAHYVLEELRDLTRR